MSENAIVAEPREATGKGVARKLRAAGRIPAVLYGGGGEAQSLTVDPRELERLLHASGAGMNTLIDLAVGGQHDTVLVKSLDRDPVRGRYLHADFYRVDLTKKIEVTVPVHLVGKAVGVDFGGVLDHPVREVTIECLPNQIPESLDVDVAALEVGMSIHINEMTLPDGIDMKSDGQLAVATVVLPKQRDEEEVEEEVAEGEEAPTAADADEKPAEGGDAS